MARLALLVALVLAAAAPAPGPDGLRPGEFSWHPERSPAGPVVVVANLEEQRLRVYRNGVEIAVSTISSGRKGHRTPTGVFTILEKEQKHFSSIYNAAPMPYMERLTWDGIAMHAGHLPGYPASHGCVRLPLEFSKLLYGVTSKGATVVIADAHAPPALQHPGLLLPSVPTPDPKRPGEAVPPVGAPAADEGASGEWSWRPEAAPDGPISVLLSYPDRQIYVYRHGVEIGRARLTLREPAQPFVPGVFTLLDQTSSQPNPYVPGANTPRWLAISLRDEPASDAQQRAFAERVTMPPEFAARLFAALTPGATLLLTDLPATAETRSVADFTILATAEPGETPAPAD